jgi:hypothetical protein
MKKGGSVASRRADGCVIRGKTKERLFKWPPLAIPFLT